MLFNDVTPAVKSQIELIDAILQAPDKASRQEAIHKAAETLGKHPRTIKQMISRVQREGIATLAVGRKDKGQFRISQQWFDFIIELHIWGQKEGSRLNHNQVHVHLQALASQGQELKNQAFIKKYSQKYPEVFNDLIANKFPSHVTVYKVINFYLEQTDKKVRHPGSPADRQIIQTTQGILELKYSNQIWQADHTKLDILLVSEGDQNPEVIGRPYITLVMDSYSGCVCGFYLGYEPAGSHEVGLALRHAILPKHYGLEYELQTTWNVYGVPEYWLTDRAKEFKSEHLKQISLDLGFQRRLRAFPQAGGLIESIFDKINKEVLSILPGYTGSNVEERPKDAEKYAALTLTELEKILVKYFVDHYNRHDYPRTREQKRFERWELMLIEEPKVLDERTLDICLMKTTRRKVEKYGCVRFEGLVYQGECLASYAGQQISLRYDQRNIVTLLAYSYPKDDEPGHYLGVVKARDLEKEQISLGELKFIKKNLRKSHQKVDNSAILNERLSLFEFVEEKRKTKRQQRKKSQENRARKTNQSKVLELFPQNAPSGEVKIIQEISAQQELQSVTESLSISLPENVEPAQFEQVQSITESSSISLPEDVEPAQSNQPALNQVSRKRRSRQGVQDWNQLLQDNW
jgi:putative transposase